MGHFVLEKAQFANVVADWRVAHLEFPSVQDQSCHITNNLRRTAEKDEQGEHDQWRLAPDKCKVTLTLPAIWNGFVCASAGFTFRA